jgi:S1-C subfamily serine protease
VEDAVRSALSHGHRTARFIILRDGQTRTGDLLIDAARAETDGREIQLGPPSLGLRVVPVTSPEWVEGKEGALEREKTPVGLRIESLDPAGAAARAGFMIGDIILSWSADSWKVSPDDGNLMAFDGRSIPNPDGLDPSVARAHGANAILFRVARVDSGGAARVQKVTLAFDRPTAP